MAVRRGRLGRLGAGAVALVLLAGGCSDDDTGTVEEGATTTEVPADDEEATTTTAADDDEGSGALDVTAVDFAFQGLPEEINGGAVAIDFTNEGEVGHEIAFVEIGDASNAETFFDDFTPVFEGGPFPDYVESLVGANSLDAGEADAFTYTLDAGTYMAFCSLTGTVEDPESEDGPFHFTQGMQQLVTVTAPEGEVALGPAEGTITARDYTFDVDLSAGDQIINFTNEGEADHFAGFDRFPEGTSPEDAEAAFQTLISLEEGQAPPEGTPESEEVGFSGIASSGQSIQFPTEDLLTPGTYVFYCFISDRSGGPPHAIAYQMFKAVTVE